MTTVRGLLGPRVLLYLDFIASGRALESIESIIHDRVLPCYGNTHSVSSWVGEQMFLFREEAKEEVCNARGPSYFYFCQVRRALHATQTDHAVIFCGSGSTAAINLLVDVLQLKCNRLSNPEGLTVNARTCNARDDNDLISHPPPTNRARVPEVPLILIGAMEHHSNILPWQDSVCMAFQCG